MWEESNRGYYGICEKGEVKWNQGLLKLYAEGCELPSESFDVIIPHHLALPLIAFLDTEGYIRPKMDNQSRAEDLKIVHRLFDLLEEKS